MYYLFKAIQRLNYQFSIILPIRMIKTGVIGVGRMGLNHVRIYSRMGGLAGVCDSDPEKVRAVADEFSCAAYRDPETFLRESGVELVSIATPTSMHFEMAKEALEAGVNVLLEKPICATVEEGRRLIDVSKSSGAVLSVGHIERYNPVVRLTKDVLDGGRIGSVISVNAIRASPFPPRITDVGVIMDIGIHDIDLVRYFIGSDVVTVAALASQSRHPTYEDSAHILLGFESGCISHINVNWMTPKKIRKLYLIGSEGFAEADLMARTLLVTNPDGSSEILSAKKENALEKEIEDIMEAISTGSPCTSMTPEDALAALGIAKACEEAYRSCNCIQMR